MASFMRVCDVRGTVADAGHSAGSLGVITRMRVAGIELAPDQTVNDPCRCGVALPVVARLDSIRWGRGVTDAVELTGRVSAAHRNQLAMLVLSDPDCLEVTFRLLVCDRDADTGACHPVWQSDRDLQGTILRAGREFAVSVADEPSLAAGEPDGYAFHLGIVPAEGVDQAITLASSATRRVVMPWGVPA